MFEVIVWIAIVMFAIALLSTLVLVLRTDNASKAVLGDMLFYCMIGIYIIWTLVNDTSITYEVALLGGLLGLLSTVSLARIVTKGRR